MKKNIMKLLGKKIFGFSLIAFLVLSMTFLPISNNVLLVAAATDPIGTLETPVTVKFGDKEVNPESADDLVGSLITIFVNLAFGIAIILVLFNLVMGAYMWIMSGGKSDKIAAGRDKMLWAIIGLLMVAASWGITLAVRNILTGETSDNLEIKILQDK